MSSSSWVVPPSPPRHQSFRQRTYEGGAQRQPKGAAAAAGAGKSYNDQCIVPPPLDVSSDSVHCNALTQSSTVSYAFSCHTIDTCGEEQDVESASALPPPHSHLWVHVFSKSSSTTSLHTQCAAAAVTHWNVLSP